MKLNKSSVLQFGIVILLFSLACGSFGTDTSCDTPKVGCIAPDFSLQSSLDDTITLSSLRGKIVLVNFWASWCGPCQAEMPAIQNVFSKYSEQLVILGVNDEDTKDTLHDFANQFGLTFPLLMDSTGSVSSQYRIRAYPSTFFVDGEGYIFHIMVGSMTESDIENIIAYKIDETVSPEQELEQGQAPEQDSIPPTQPPGQLSSVEGCVSVGALNVRTGPSMESEVVDWVYRDECYLFEGRSSDSNWLRLANTWLGKGKWVSAKYINLKAPIDTLPFSD